MSLASIKDFLSHHAEKIVLAVVVLFVAKVVCSYATAPESAPTRGGRGGPPPATANAAVRPHAERTATPYIAIPDATAPIHDWFHPPRIRQLPPVQLDLKKKPKARIALGARAVAPPRVVSLTAEELQALPRLKGSPGVPCQVDAQIDPRSRDAVIVSARGTGNWRKFEVRLENEDRAWLYVVVAEPEDIIQSKVAPPKVLSIGEEKLGAIHIKFTIPTGEVRDEDRHTVTKYLEPTHFLIYRKSEFNTEFQKIGRVDARPPETPPGERPLVPPGAPRHPGLPVAPGPRVPRRHPTPRPQEPEEQKAPEFEFVDTGVESETYYVYKIVSVRPPEGGIGEPATAESPQVECQTKAKFTFAYTGGGMAKANIVVFIGSRENPQDYRKFQVKVGQRIGTMPPELRKTNATEEPAAERSEQPKPETDHQYVTRFVLVDIVPRVFRVVPQVRRLLVSGGVGGRAQYKEVVTYTEQSINQVILRDRHNRLLRLWFEHEQNVIPPQK